MARGRKAATETPIVNTEETAEVKMETVAKEETVKKDQRDIEIELLKQQVEEMKALIATKETQPAPVVQMVTPESERVTFLMEAELADDNVFLVGENGIYGRIVGKTGTFMVPKNDLSRVMDGIFRMMLDKRWIIAVSGLTEEEREAYGVNYKEGEYLDKRAFAKMVDLGEEIIEIYPKLCDGHKQMVAKRYYEAYKNGNYKVTREIVTKLNQLSKEAGSEKGDFTGIIEMMNAKDAS